jgi:hypothetical protein
MKVMGEFSECLRALDRRVTSEMNTKLIKEFTMEEVGTTLNQMLPFNGLRPDGFPISFFQKHWATIGIEVSQAVLDILNSSSLNIDFNLTYIAQIQKVKHPTCVTEFRPISLCNVLYKIISKVLTNYLKVVLPNLISQNQSAFISARLITNNVLAAYETLHTMH